MQNWTKRIVLFLFFGATTVSAQESLKYDLLYPSIQDQKHTAFRPTVDKSDDKALFNLSAKELKLRFNPAFDLLFGTSDQAVNRLGYGVAVKMDFRKWRAGFTYLHSRGKYLNYQDEFIRENRVLPAMGVSSGSGTIQADYYNAHLGFNPNNIFDFELGYGRNFIGDGHRSLLLSDFGQASPYLKIQTTFWNLQYTNLFAIHENIFNVEGEPDFYQRKYSATHFLDWKATSWLSVGLFETVIWQHNQGNYNRGFDVNYLNPVIFYRPVEFSTGSSDNVMVGANLKITPTKQHVFYFQLLFDEF
ncbi:MAG: hypothetical protein WD530_07440, partial [Vicingaceae bacterium]